MSVKYTTSEFRSGLKVLFNGCPCSILRNEFIKPGKGQAFNRVKLRDLQTGRVLEKTFKSGESLESADVLEKEMQYLYSDGSHWHFMDMLTYEQVTAGSVVMEEAKLWLKESAICTVTLYNDEPLLVAPPSFVTLKVVQTDPNVKGNTAQGGNKSAVLETDAVVRVPLFIDNDELIKVDTRTGEYVSRVRS